MQTQSTSALWDQVLEDHNKDTAVSSSGGGGSNDDPFPQPSDPEDLPAVDIPRLRSALASLDPDCDEKTWLAHRVGALANTAQEFPEYRGQLYELAWQFSSGKLANKPAQTWTKSGPHGRPRRTRLAQIWQNFCRSKYDPSKRATIGSIFFHARAQGWSGDATGGEQQQ
jgi:hypothetical protein